MTELKPNEVVEAMIEYVRANLKLQDREETTKKGQKQVITFTGRGIAGVAKDKKYALDLVIQYNRAASIKFISDLVAERSDNPNPKDIISTSLLFPKSLDYDSAKVRVTLPYFRQANLLSTTSDEIGLFDLYKEFNNNNIKDLSRVEWMFAIELGRANVQFECPQIAYFNPKEDGQIDVHYFKKIGVNRIIPDHRSLDQEYLWKYVKKMHFPSNWDNSKEAETFRGIQQGLHDRIREIMKTVNLTGTITLTRQNDIGARIADYNEIAPLGYQHELF